ncbi:MAG: c-type cytochrome, partial [Comamonadaceae bacterium]
LHRDQATAQREVGAGRAESVARRVAGLAMRQPAHEVGAAVPLGRAIGFRHEAAGREEEGAPHRQRRLRIVGKAQIVRPVRLPHRGLAHCQACHAPRNAFGATSTDLALSGGLIPMQNWYAPSLGAPGEAGVQDWPVEEIVRLLKTGTTSRGATMGPMAEVVAGSTQHLADADLRAMAIFLQALPRHDPPAPRPVVAERDALVLGERLYRNNCAQCHGDQGEGAGAAAPALAGHRTVTMGTNTNLLRVILGGGFPPTTEGNPRPFGMPPFGHSLTDTEIAAVASYVRGAWGNTAPAVLPLDVQKVR